MQICRIRCHHTDYTTQTNKQKNNHLSVEFMNFLKKPQISTRAHTNPDTHIHRVRECAVLDDKQNTHNHTADGVILLFIALLKPK